MWVEAQRRSQEEPGRERKEMYVEKESVLPPADGGALARELHTLARYPWLFAVSRSENFTEIRKEGKTARSVFDR